MRTAQPISYMQQIFFSRQFKNSRIFTKHTVF